MLKRITEFETQHTVLGKRRVAHSEEILTSAKIAAVDVSQRNETLTRDLIVNQRVAMGESPALNVLSRQSNVVTFVEQRRKSQRFSHGPIYPFTAVDHGATIFVHTLHDAMRRKAGRYRGDEMAKVLQMFVRKSGVCDARQLVWAFKSLPMRCEPVSLFRHVILGRFKLIFHDGGDFFFHVDEIIRCDVAFVDELGAVLSQYARMLLNNLIHERLRKHGFIDFVVSILAIADDVDHRISFPLHSPLGSEFHDPSDGLDVVAVYVEYRHFHALGHIRTVRTRARILGISRKSDLIIDDDVQSPSDTVFRKFAHVERFVHDALATESTVAV